jgi:O-antigen/teichoic acid export membrane protein
LALLAEGSYDPENLRNQVIKAFKFTLLLVLPIVIILLTMGKIILTLYGAQYSGNSLTLLRLLSVGWLPNIASAIYTSVLRIQKRTGPLILMWGFYAIFAIFAGYIMVRWFGINGLGIAWLVSQTVVGLIAVIMLMKMFGKSPKQTELRAESH